MLDAFLKVAYESEKKSSAYQRMVADMKQLPKSELIALAEGRTKLACGGCGDSEEWLEKFEGTPFQEDALALEQQSLEVQIARQQRQLEESEERKLRESAGSELYDQEDSIRLNKRILDLKLTKYKLEGETGVEEEEPTEEAPEGYEGEEAEGEEAPELPQALPGLPAAAQAEEEPVEEEEAPEELEEEPTEEELVEEAPPKPAPKKEEKKTASTKMAGGLGIPVKQLFKEPNPVKDTLAAMLKKKSPVRPPPPSARKALSKQSSTLTPELQKAAAAMRKEAIGMGVGGAISAGASALKGGARFIGSELGNIGTAARSFGVGNALKAAPRMLGRGLSRGAAQAGEWASKNPRAALGAAGIVGAGTLGAGAVAGGAVGRATAPRR